MTFTYDLSTDVGRVRRTIPDKDEDDAFWTDEELDSFLTDEGDWRRASAACLESMASDSAIVLKLIQVRDLRADGTAVSRALLQRAQSLRDLADVAEANEGSTFEVIEQVVNDFSYRQRVLNQALDG